MDYGKLVTILLGAVVGIAVSRAWPDRWLPVVWGLATALVVLRVWHAATVRKHVERTEELIARVRQESSRRERRGPDRDER
jgi:uncharacterized membrane protein YfcA